jgi:hypothetical protein
MHTSYLAERSKSKEVALKRAFAMSIRSEPFGYLNIVGIRWRDAKLTSLEYMDTECRTIESHFCDVVIGWRTMQKLRLYVRNSDLIDPTLTHNECTNTHTKFSRSEGQAHPSSED